MRILVIPSLKLPRLRNPVLFGLLAGAAFGLWDLIATRLHPVAEDTAVALLKFYGPMFTLWGFAGFRAARRTGRVLDAVKVAVVVAFATFVVYDLAVIVRVNLFLDTISQRSDWQNLVAGFQASGSKSLRAYANQIYVIGAPFKILVASIIGACTGLVGGFFGRLGRHEVPRDAVDRQIALNCSHR
jgi:hypothetical protein